MAAAFYFLIFLISSFLLAISSRWLVQTITKISKFLEWKEFVVAFFTMAFGVSLPNFFVGIISVIKKTPQLSFGDVIGGNIIDLSLVLGTAAIISKMGLSAPSRTVQGSSIFTIIIALLPLLLIADDGVLGRGDAIILILVFFAYVFWLFGKEERFKKIYDGIEEKMTPLFFVKNFLLFLISLIILLAAAKGIVDSAIFFAAYFNFPITIIGIFLVGLGNSLPEFFFSIQAAKKGQDWLVLGDIIGGVIITATLVLAIVAFLSPIEISDFSTIAVARLFLIISAFSFLFFLRTEKKISKREGFFLLAIYFLFLIIEIISKRKFIF